MRALIQVLLASAAIAAACASQSSDSTERFSLLEARLERLEARTIQGASDASDAPVVEAGHVEYAPDSGPPRRFYDGGYPDPDAQGAEIASCKLEAPNRCAEELLHARIIRERKTGTKPRWLKAGPVAADSTPEGRACIQKKSQECDHRFQRSKVLTWLDAQLEPGKRDDKFTNEMRAKIGAALGVAPDSVNVVCAPQFCRVAGDAVGTGLGEEFGGSMSDGSYHYWIRRGFDLAQ